jgi:hypothetical protein
MKIEHIGGCDPHVLCADLANLSVASRFRFVPKMAKRYASYNPIIEIKGVRLKTRKEYCGSHPGACELAFREHRNTAYLEGADWVEFNDMLNNHMDKHNISCVIWSAPTERQRSQATERMRIRIGMHRRIRYDMRPNESPFRGNSTWELNGNVADFCVPRFLESGLPDVPFTYSEFPSGTPGIHKPLNYACIG